MLNLVGFKRFHCSKRLIAKGMVFINSAYACVHVCELNIITKWDSYDLLQCRENADGVQRVQGWNARQNPKKTP